LISQFNSLDLNSGVVFKLASGIRKGVGMRPVKLAPLVLSVFLIASSASAEPFDGVEFGKLCNRERFSAEYISCLAYIKGFMEGLRFVDGMSGSGVHYCLPKTVGAEQAVLVVQNFFREHPEDLNEYAGKLVGLAFYSAFPCESN